MSGVILHGTGLGQSNSLRALRGRLGDAVARKALGARPDRLLAQGGHRRQRRRALAGKGEGALRDGLKLRTHLRLHLRLHLRFHLCLHLRLHRLHLRLSL